MERRGAGRGKRVPESTSYELGPGGVATGAHRCRTSILHLLLAHLGDGRVRLWPCLCDHALYVTPRVPDDRLGAVRITTACKLPPGHRMRLGLLGQAGLLLLSGKDMLLSEAHGVLLFPPQTSPEP